MFSQTNIPKTIENQNNGQPLIVDGAGTFNVEWHLAGDFETLKCLYGCDLGQWSAQGMERSHWQARGAYHNHTRHGGGTGGSNALEELFMWHFLMMLGVQSANKKKLKKEIFDIDRLEEVSKR